MKTIISSKKWLRAFFCRVLLLLALLSIIAYIIDPFLQFRVRDNTYELCEYTASGLIKNYSYDYLIIGSSMTQNFDMDVVRKELNVQPLHIGIGGMTNSEMLDLMKAAYETGSATEFVVCVDLHRFTEDAPVRHIPKYLSRNDCLSSFRYLLSHEVWFHYLPLDVGLVALDKAGISLASKLNINTNVDRYQHWSATFGADVVLDNYKSGEYRVSEVDTDDLYNRMTNHIDDFFMGFDFTAGKHTFFFPPYSALYWCDAQNSGYFDAYLYAKQYFVEKANEYGANVYDFQCADFTTDLDNYKDTTHYRPEINDWMVECFASKDYLATTENYGTFQEKLIENTNSFRNEYADLFR